VFILLNACEFCILGVPIDERYLYIWVSLLGQGEVRLVRRVSDIVSSEKSLVTAGSQQIGGKPLILLWVNCSSILNKILVFWNLVNTCNPYVIKAQSWLRVEINNSEVFMDDYTTFRL